MVSKLFRAYGLYNVLTVSDNDEVYVFQSSFELTGYITVSQMTQGIILDCFKALSSLRVI